MTNKSAVDHSSRTCNYFACNAGTPDSRCPFVANPKYRPRPEPTSALDDFIEKYDGDKPMLAPNIKTIFLELAKAIRDDLEAIKKGDSDGKTNRTN